jgi:DNA-binding NarL/FixJ family response regulator
MRVLVVDDDRSVRDALRRALTLAGYEVQMAEGGQQALTQAATAVPKMRSCSTWACRTSSASRSAGACAGRAIGERTDAGGESATRGAPSPRALECLVRRLPMSGHSSSRS